MNRIALFLGIVAALAVGSWYFVAHSPDCNAWQERVISQAAQIDASGPGREAVYIQDKLEPSRPWGCPRPF